MHLIPIFVWKFLKKFDYKIYMVNIMCQKSLLHISM
jgi:hypothetical protein